MINLKDVATDFAPISAFEALEKLVLDCGVESVQAALNEIAAQQSVQRTALPVKAKVVCFNGHARVVEGKDFDDACPECGAGIGEYDSRFGGE